MAFAAFEKASQPAKAIEGQVSFYGLKRMYRATSSDLLIYLNGIAHANRPLTV